MSRPHGYTMPPPRSVLPTDVPGAHRWPLFGCSPYKAKQRLSEHPCGQQRSDSRSVTVAAATDGHEERQPRGSKRAGKGSEDPKRGPGPEAEPPPVRPQKGA